jgi:Zn finger protein HypA/HybF involved in hydrogenase expression
VRERPDRKEPLVSGETVTPGKFECLECGEKVEIDHVTNLPVCPRCQNETWKEA